MSVSLDSVTSSVSPRRRRASRRLLSAIHRNNLALTQKALAQHADLAWADPSTGWTPLELSALRWRPALAAIILSRMSDGQSQYLRPRALDLLLEQWPAQASQSGAARSTLDALLAGSSLAFIESRHPWGWLGYAVELCNPNLAALLASLGAQVNWLGPSSQNLLHLAVEVEAFSMINWCLGQGMDVNAVDGDGNSPLHIAAQSGSLVLADRLVRAGGWLDMANQEDQTPLDLASSSGKKGDAWQARVRKNRLLDTLPDGFSPPNSYVRF